MLREFKKKSKVTSSLRKQGSSLDSRFPDPPFGRFRTGRGNDKGFSLVEALVASLIFASVVVGVFATMSSFKRPSVEADKKLMAAFYGKQILEDLRVHVDQRDWDTGLLASNPALNPHGPFQIFNPTYNITFNYSYTVVDEPGGSGARQVLLNITWPD